MNYRAKFDASTSRPIGSRVGHWTIVGYEWRERPRYADSGSRRRFVRVRCDCGTTKTLAPYSLGGKGSNSCGCIRTAQIVARSTKHGAVKTPEYQAWNRMKGRCLNPNARVWKWYGGAGVTVHSGWMDDFPAFLRDVGPRPGPEYTLDRINPFGNYEPGNVRWATWDVQRRNKRRSYAVQG